MKRSCKLFHHSVFVLMFVASITAPAAAKDLIGSAGWKAIIDRAQPSPPRLVITARLHLPTPGYSASLKLVRVQTSNPPIPVYELVLIAPTKPVIQVLTWINFRHVAPLAGTPSRTVIIVYRGKTLARLEVANAGN